MPNLFLYGSLLHRPLLESVLCHGNVDWVEAEFTEHAVYWADGQGFPMVCPEPGQTAHGRLLRNPSEEDVARLNYFESDFGYDLTEVEVRADGKPIKAKVYIPKPGLWQKGAKWKLSDWVAKLGDVNTLAAKELMEGFGRIPSPLAALKFPQMQQRAASRLRAETETAGGAGFTVADDVRVEDVSVAHSGFFRLEEHKLKFRRYDGSFSNTVGRTAFLGGDAVTVLPYDPVRDRVLLIEQFRVGPYARGDQQPWGLEPVAGRIDAGEDAASCALRELREEAGLESIALHSVASYYPTPGAFSEYVYSFVAIANLPDDAAKIGGVEDEAEDILGKIFTFEDALMLVESGKANNSPLIISMQWLRVNRERLMSAA